jgi:uncharacterized membrane protein
MRKVLEAICLGLLATLIGVTWSALHGAAALPERIPTHFDASGHPNAWGSPGALWLLPGVAVGLYLLITLVSQFPSAFKFPVRPAPQNRARIETLTLQMLAWVKTELAGLFLYIQWSILQSVRQGNASLNPWFMPVFMVVVFATMILHGVAVFRAARGGVPNS